MKSNNCIKKSNVQMKGTGNNSNDVGIDGR